MRTHGIEAIDMVVANLYPFQSTVRWPPVNPPQRCLVYCLVYNESVCLSVPACSSGVSLLLFAAGSNALITPCWPVVAWPPLAPLAQVRSGADFSTCIENIDIGGPSMIRAAAKNHAFVTVVTSPDQYSTVLDNLTRNDGCTDLQLRRHLACEAFSCTAVRKHDPGDGVLSQRQRAYLVCSSF
jgi:hypothetical protein